jgi:glycosyltransferase involved in cell wall biosynthesis
MNNICFFNSIGFWGGGEKLHLEYAIELQKKGYTVWVLCKADSPLAQKATQNHLQTTFIDIKTLSFLNPFKIINLIQFFRQKNIDTLILSTSQDLKIGSIAAKIAKIKNIVYLRGLAVPVKASPINRLIFNSFLTHIIANSEETKKSLLKYLGKYINHAKIQTIYHGIEFANKTPYSTNNNQQPKILKAIQEQSKGIILGNAGRLTAQKGQEKLIQVAKKLKDQQIHFTLFIAGTGEKQTALETLITDLGLNKEVILLGFVSEMESFMSSIDIFLLSSAWEGFGYVLVEAMAQAKPIVAFDITSNPEIVATNETGFLVPYPDIESFAEKTIQLIENKTLRKTMGEAGFYRAYTQFNMHDRITEFEQYLLNK